MKLCKCGCPGEWEILNDRPDYQMKGVARPEEFMKKYINPKNEMIRYVKRYENIMKDIINLLLSKNVQRRATESLPEIYHFMRIG